MLTSYDIRKKITAKKARINKILSTVDASPEYREMTPEETTEFNALKAEVASLKGRLATLEEMESDEDGPITPPAEARTRFGQPIVDDEPADAPAVHTKIHKHSNLRALQLHFVEHRSLNGIEGEVNKEIARKVGRPASGVYLPLGNEPEFRELIYGKNGPERRDLTTATAPGGIFTMPELPLIEMLRNKLVVKQAGARVITDAQGNFAFTRQTGTATAYWLGENVPAAPSNQATDQAVYSGKQCLALTNISKAFLKQNSFDAEQFVKDDLAMVLAQAVDLAALNGAGGSTTPLGILQDTAVQALSAGLAGAGANGDALTWARIVGLETALNNANANRGRPALVTSNTVRGALKNTARLGNTSGIPVWENPSDESSDGWVNGYRAFATSNVPSNLSKGSATNLSAAIFGNFADLILAQWGGIDTLINPFTLQASGGETISAAIFADSHVVRPQSFRILTDVKTD